MLKKSLLTSLSLLLFCSTLGAQQPEADTRNPTAGDRRPETTVNQAPSRLLTLTYTDAVILGLVEGITEYLPISSTGHLILTNELLGLNQNTPLTPDSASAPSSPNPEPFTLKEAADAYAIIIQAGAIAAVVLLYWKRLLGMAAGLLGKDPEGLRLARNIIISFIPAVILGLLLDDLIEFYLFGPVPVIIALIAGGILMLAVEGWRKKQSISTEQGGSTKELDLPDLSVKQALTIGLLQCVAMWPGTSRSMMTIVGGYVVGLKPARAAEYSFLLGLITLSAAAAYKTLKSGEMMMQVLDPGPVLLGILIAFISAALAIKWLVAYLTRHGLALFAIYRFFLAALAALFLL